MRNAIKTWLLILSALAIACFMAGCGLTASERDEIIAKSTALASDHAGEIAGKIVYEQAVKDGKTIEEAQAMAKKATDIANVASQAVASAAATKAADDLANGKGEKTSSAWGAALIGLLGIAGSVLKVFAK